MNIKNSGGAIIIRTLKRHIMVAYLIPILLLYSSFNNFLSSIKELNYIIIIRNFLKSIYKHTIFCRCIVLVLRSFSNFIACLSGTESRKILLRDS